MDNQLKDDVVNNPVINSVQLDPLRRVLYDFQTKDSTRYHRYVDGSIHHVRPKMNGKHAKKLRAQLRKAKRVTRD